MSFLTPISSRLVALTSLACAIIASLFVLVLGSPAAQAAPLTVTSVPAANTVLNAAPSRVAIQLPAGSNVTSGRVTVFSAAHQPVVQGALTSQVNEPKTLALAIPAATKLDKGVYSVVWTAGADTGTSAFDLEPAGTSPATVKGPKAVTELGPLRDGVIAWTAWITLMTFVGVLALILFATAPIARKLNGDVLTATTTRLARIGSVAIVLFIPAFLLNLAHDASEDDGFAFGSIKDELSGGFPGTVNLIELLLAIVGLLLVVPLTSRAFAGRPRRQPLVIAGTVAGSLALIATKFPTAVPPDWNRSVFSTVMWAGHLIGAAVWIGGLIGLLACALPGVVTADVRGGFWPGVLRRFSISAMACVAALILSGLWLYWVHVGGLSQLFSTLYGRVLGVKLLVFGALLLIGAFNQFWLSPKLEALRAAGDDSSITKLLARHFRTAIAIEAILGLSILLIAPFLHGSSRNQAFQAKQTDLSQSATVDGQRVKFTPSGLQPGLTDYTVRLSNDDARTVAVSFQSAALGVPTAVVQAIRVDTDTFRVTGYYTPQVGVWNADVTVDGAAPASFELPIAAKVAKLKKSSPALVEGTTWLYGTLETIAVIAAMLGGLVVSGRIARSRVRAAQENQPAEEPRELVDVR